jgi:hypothetical protein
MPSSEKDTEGTTARRTPREFAEAGWAEGRNIQIDYRWAPQGDQLQTAAKELVPRSRIDPGQAIRRPQRAARDRTISIVFVTVGDPIGGGRLAMQRDSLISSPRLVASGLSF